MKFSSLINVPKEGAQIRFEKGKIKVPSHPVIPFIEGEGIGPEIMRAAQRVLDTAVRKAYAGNRSLKWVEVYAGEKALSPYGNLLPPETLRTVQHFTIALKGPLGTPIGEGYRSLNVALRQRLDLYACVRPLVYYPGVPSPMKDPSGINMVIFRENTEDVYAGFEWQAESDQAESLTEFIGTKLRITINKKSGIGIKPMSERATKRLMRKALAHAFANRLRNVTVMHKGNIMKYTEGAFREWCYEVAREEFPEGTLTEQELWENHNGEVPTGKIVIKDRIADNMFQQLLLRPQDFDVIVTPNLNGDYLSDAAAALVGGLGIAPGANIGDRTAVFEATHGTAPMIAGQNSANPTSLILSGVMMLEHLGWNEAATLVRHALQLCFSKGRVTKDLAGSSAATPLSTSDFTNEVIAHI